MRPTLYFQAYCPYCHRVLRAAERLGLHLELVETSEDLQAHARLLDKRGRGTVPVLGIPTASGEQLMGESSDIVAWLQNNAAQIVKVNA